MSPTQVALPAHLELYRNILQENGAGIRGLDLKEHLAAVGRLKHCVRLDDEEVRGWILRPASYPDELKGKKVLLLTSNSNIGTQGCVACLQGSSNCVEEVPVWLQNIINGEYHVLLRRSR